MGGGGGCPSWTHRKLSLIQLVDLCRWCTFGMCKARQLRPKRADSSRMCLPFRHGLGGADNTREQGGGKGTLSDAPLVVNRKWHSSSSAFPPPPHLVLLVFCLLFFCTPIVMSWTGRWGPAHVCDAIPEMSLSGNKAVTSMRTRAGQLQEATDLGRERNPYFESFLTLRSCPCPPSGHPWYDGRGEGP